MARWLESVALRLNLECSNCHGPVYGAGFAARVVCPACARHLPTDWDDYRDIVLEALVSKPGKERSASFFLRDLQGSIRCVRELPACPECKAALPIDALADAQSVRCSCGAEHRVRAAPDIAHVLVPGALWVVGEGVTADAESQEERAPILMNCNACAGDLALDGDTDRNLTCRYCSSLNVIPDALWIRLHPELQQRTFWVVAAIGEREQRAMRIRAKWHGVGMPGRKPLVSQEGPVASWPEPTSDAFTVLTRTEDPDVLAHMLQQADFPEDIIESLAEHKKANIRIAVAERDGLPEPLQLALAGDKSAGVRAAIAGRVDLAPDALVALKADGHKAVRRALEQQDDPTVPQLLALANAGYADAIEALTRIPIPAEAVPGFAAHADVRLRKLAARHADLPDDALDALATDDDPAIHGILIQRKALPDRLLPVLADSPAAEVQAFVAKQPATDEDLLRKLAAGSAFHRVLRRSDCPVDILSSAARGDDGEAHALVAHHQATPDEVLVHLAGLSLGFGAMNALAEREWSPLVAAAMVSAHAKELRLRAAGLPDLDPAALERLAADSESDVRRAIAGRDDLPIGVATTLAGDADPSIAEVASAHEGLVRRQRNRRLVIGAVVGSVALCGGLAVASVLGLGAGVMALISP